MSLNVVSTVCIALVLKQLFLLNPTIPITGLVVFHILCACLMANVLWFFGWFRLPPFGDVNWKYLLTYSVFQGLAIATANANLEHNSIGFYQISKMAVIPVTILAETLLGWRKIPNAAVLMSLVVLLVGVGLVTGDDVQITTDGTFWALFSVFSITSVQLLVSQQKENNLSPFQLLHLSTIPSATNLMIISYFVDDLRGAVERGLTKNEFVLLMLSGVLSVSINLTSLMIIGEASPVTYQVIGHLKTISLIISGTILFKVPVANIQIVGIILALAGTARYGQLKLQQKNRPNTNK
eukprot:CAMPEP_0201540552 /NCGR_PEP_ID=MMETSP0161_2-20130828/71004_1 /ASSEMBLY_ACC=CAM_ASM_000251 /TAXON_ID=180227 /ORGANISM="Neoparamoeba aestuarina, Strain SoJaBio B1-5/56/2" /LENGTH=294 /DNA_ID=CAMNT_0047948029 /DNA_START=542 /DNA_END=1426 /DNA_ORIENTATION=-